MQFGGWFGLAIETFPRHGVAKHEPRAVEELARQPQSATACATAVDLVATDRMADRQHVRADLVRAPGLELDAQQRAAGKLLDDLEVGDRAARPGEVRNR